MTLMPTSVPNTQFRYITPDPHRNLQRLRTGFADEIDRNRCSLEASYLRTRLYGAPEQRESRLLAELGREDKYLGRDFLIIQSIMDDYQYGTGDTKQLSTDYACILLQHMIGDKPPTHLERLIELYFRHDAQRKAPPLNTFGRHSRESKEKYMDSLGTGTLLFNMIYSPDSFVPLQQRERFSYFEEQLQTRGIREKTINSNMLVPIMINHARKYNTSIVKSIVSNFENSKWDRFFKKQ